MKDTKDIKPGPLSSRSIIRFQDCDPYGHLNNGRYLDYFMNAREDQVLAAYDFDIYAYSRKTGFGWVVSQNQVAYLKPALLREEVIMESQLIAVGHKFIQVEMRMRDITGQIKSLLWAHFVHIDIRAAKSAVHPEDLQNMFEHILLSVEETDFAARLKRLAG